MKDTITINLKALTQDTRDKISQLIDGDLNLIPDEQNEEALESLREFKDDD